nr:hypothetical protein [Blastococcus sp. TML/M2B]
MPQPPGPAGGQLAQQRVAGAVPVAVVDQLEVVEVEDGHGERLAGAQRVGQVPRGRGLPRAPVRDAGERIGVGGVAQLPGQAALHLGEREHGDHQRDPGREEPRRRGRGGAGAGRRDQDDGVHPRSGERQHVRGVERHGDHHRAEPDDAGLRHRPPGQDADQQGHQEQPRVDGPRRQLVAQQREHPADAHAGAAQDPEQLHRGVRVHRPGGTGEAQGSADEVERRQQRNRRRPVGAIHVPILVVPAPHL